MAEPRLTIRGLKIAYSSKDRTSNPIVGRFFHRDLNTRLIIRDLNLTVNDGEILGLVGESGSGKSVTVKSIFGMINFFPGIIGGEIKYHDPKGNEYVILDSSNGKAGSPMDPQIEFIDRTHHDGLNDLQSDPIESYTYDGSLNHEPYKNGQKYEKQLGMYSIVNRSMSLVKNHSYQIEAAYNRFKKKGHNLRGKEVSIILQDPITFLNPHWSIKKQLKNLIRLFPPSDRDSSMPGLNEIENWHLTKKILDELRIGSDEFLDKIPSELSGGQAQRVMIVLSRMSIPNLLIADEPTTGLDVTLKMKVVEFFRKRAKSMIFISHDLNMVRMVSDRINIMYNGEIVENCDSKNLDNSENHHPFTEKLSEVFFSDYKDYISVELPDQEELSNYSGCVYALQGCPYVEDICHNINPPAISIQKKKIVSDVETEDHWAKCWKFLK